ncbi:HMA2 domain-containing protein [Geobacter sp. SVR]|uniref:HMA2 domain-containing protein n=1 Tax=Geobacter sp. SVR TaxID=2495594 RepID=UPI00143F053F|nr:hypothetical protein [Geobacter sp. SVR]BCS53186.1 hypothetical protein GSVR_14940 [Geobacter sp. SVR]GCF84571.1 hypothetical protein GSbR_11710 [Geobacter sp. SVR]
MAPLSILPGRIRIESTLVAGRRDIIRSFEQRIMETPGTLEVSVNHRTGRILVRYDEAVVSRDLLCETISAALEALRFGELPLPPHPDHSGSRDREPAAAKHTRNILLDMAAHVLLPKPFDLLVPALGVLRG